ncbi:MAG: aminotransferase class V-fold PLP-dependent enzyme, partial [Longimicrobiales bacterium]|nr:aminotransferase class V-fold PLP-dependent enzyme [Longimicrobiales bacterium]
AQKCLLSFFGCGFLFVRREVADGLTPAHLARYGVDLDLPETAHSREPIRYRTGALRFDLGNYNYLGVSAVALSLDLIEEIGVDNVESHARALARRLVRGLLEEGVPVVGGDVGPHLAHIVTVGRFGAGQGDRDVEGLHRVLQEQAVVHTFRDGMLRFSVGLYNDETDIEMALEAVRLWRRRGSRPATRKTGS